MTDPEAEIRAIVQAGLDTISNAATNAKDALIATGDKRIAAITSTSFKREVIELVKAFYGTERMGKWDAKIGIEGVLAHLAAAGRLVPEGGMPLTAEQVEDVRLLLDSFASERDKCDTWDLYERLRALFPATEPAEDGWGDVNPNDPKGRTYRETAEEYYSAPAVPAEEETKAEEWTVRTVEERQALPKGSVIRSLTTGLVEERWGDGSWRVSGHTAVLDGSQQSAFPCEVLYPRSRPTSFAPFVAAEEGDA